MSDTIDAQGIQDREWQLRAVLDVLPLPVFISDRDGRVTSVNRAVREFWGEGAPTPERLEQYAAYRGWWPGTGQPVAAEEWAHARALRTGEAAGPDEVDVETFDGERRTILAYARAIRNENNDITGAVSISVDITSRKANEEANRFLAEAGRLLTSSLDYGETLERVASLAVSWMCDWCVIYGPARDRFERLAYAARDSAREALLLELEGNYPPGPESPVGEVIRTGEPFIIPETDDEFIEKVAQDSRHHELIQGLGLSSMIIVPLHARGTVLGAMALVSAEAGRRYGDTDMAYAERLAHWAAVAIENARVYREAEQRAAEEEALRRATAAVSSAFTIEDVVREIADSALVAMRADGALVERISPDRREIELVAASGEWALPVGARAAYEGSIAQAAIDRGEPLIVDDAGTSRSELLRELARTYGPCSALSVPLAGAGDPVGSLVLVRSLDQPAFRQDEIGRAQTFGELAAIAFRKTHLLEESERRRDELERVTESRARLIRGFSHDLKNPIGAADGHLALLEDEISGPLAPAQHENVKRIRRNLRDALELIDRLVEFQRAEAGEIPIQPGRVQMRDIVRDIVEEWRVQANNKGLSVDTQLPDEVPIIESDARRVRQILGNLMSNALKYTSEGGVTVRLEMRSGPDTPGPGQWLATDVSDTGPGIPREKLDLAFEEFARLDPDAAYGSGLGLTISRRLAEALGGAITATSKPGHGSTFTVWLPVTP